MRSSLAQLRADADALLHAADGNAERAAAKITLNTSLRKVSLCFEKLAPA